MLLPLWKLGDFTEVADEFLPASCEDLMKAADVKTAGPLWTLSKNMAFDIQTLEKNPIYQFATEIAYL